MPVCVNFNYRRVASGISTGPSAMACTSDYGTQLSVQDGGGLAPQPFTALHVLRPTGGQSTPSGRNIDAEPQVGSLPAGWPHLAKGVIVPGAAGDAGCGIYALFGQIP
jgi:hypothetical protein